MLTRQNFGGSMRTVQLTTAGPGQPFTLDGNAYDHDRIDQVVLKDSVEIWTLGNLTRASHPFHIHDIQFFILDRDDVPPAAYESGKKDTVLVDDSETVRFITKFETHSDTKVPFMYHCHILPHEDGGMMAQFILVDPATTLVALSADSSTLTLRWPENLGPGVFQLQATTNLLMAFSDVTNTPVIVGSANQTAEDMSANAQYFRLVPAD